MRTKFTKKATHNQEEKGDASKRVVQNHLTRTANLSQSVLTKICATSTTGNEKLGQEDFVIFLSEHRT